MVRVRALIALVTLVGPLGAVSACTRQPVEITVIRASTSLAPVPQGWTPEQAAAQVRGPGAVEPNATVTKAVDGDTVHVHLAGTADGETETVRLIGIDTPETHRPNTPIQCFGPEASRFTAALIPPGTPVRLERDVEERDRYGRLLAYVRRAGDGAFVNLELARNGFAHVATFPPNVAHTDEFVAAAGQARDQNLGLWRGCTS